MYLIQISLKVGDLEEMEKLGKRIVDIAITAAQNGDYQTWHQAISEYKTVKHNLSLHFWGKEYLQNLETYFHNQVSSDLESFFSSADISNIDEQNISTFNRKLNMYKNYFNYNNFVDIKPKNIEIIIQQATNRVASLKPSVKSVDDYNMLNELEGFIEDVEESYFGYSKYKKSRISQLDLLPSEIEDLIFSTQRKLIHADGMKKNNRRVSLNKIIEDINKIEIACYNLLSPLHNRDVEQSLRDYLYNLALPELYEYRHLETHYVRPIASRISGLDSANQIYSTSSLSASTYDDSSKPKGYDYLYTKLKQLAYPSRQQQTTFSSASETAKSSNHKTDVHENPEIDGAISEAVDSLKLLIGMLQDAGYQHLEPTDNQHFNSTLDFFQKSSFEKNEDWFSQYDEKIPSSNEDPRLDANIMSGILETYKSVLNEFYEYYKEHGGTREKSEILSYIRDEAYKSYTKQSQKQQSIQEPEKERPEEIPIRDEVGGELKPKTKEQQHEEEQLAAMWQNRFQSLDRDTARWPDGAKKRAEAVQVMRDLQKEKDKNEKNQANGKNADNTQR